MDLSSIVPGPLPDPLNRKTKPPQHEGLAIFLSTIVPGLGAMYNGAVRKGLRLFFLTILVIAVALITHYFVLKDGSPLLPVLHAAVALAAGAIWLYNIIITIQIYEIELNIWKKKEGTEGSGTTYAKDEVQESLAVQPGYSGDRNAANNLQFMLNNPKQAIVRMSLMVCMTFIAIKVNTFLDKVWIANIGDSAVSAISTVSPIYSVVSAIGVGVGTGACVCIAFALGKKDYSRLQDLATASLFLGIILSIPTALFLILSVDPIVSVEGAEVSRLAKEYILPLAIGSPAIILAGILGSLFKAEGSMRTMSICALLSIPVNAVLTPVFMIYCGWGIMGASAATALGSVVSMLAAFYMFKRGAYHFKVQFRLPRSSSIREVLTVGGPKAVEEALGGCVILAQTMVIAINTGSPGLAITGLGFTFPYLMTMIPDSITAGTQPVCSAQAGAHNVDMMRMVMRYSSFLVIVLTIIAMIVLLVFAEPIVTVFGERETLEEEDLVTAVRIYALMMPFYLLQRMACNLLQVVRKSHISAPLYVGFGLVKLTVLFFFGTEVMSVVYIDASITVVAAIVTLLALGHYSRTFDPGKVEATEKILETLPDEFDRP